ncbi:MAG: hypothetical protein JRN15_06960, partial [Nitrososphaerota archaeon]|nr:hypothetical protein [Nitrososphaerota archaeon]
MNEVSFNQLLPKRFEEFKLVRRECGIVLRVAVSENASEFLASFPLIENEMVGDVDAASDQILTKRPERILNHLPTSWTQGFSHVWIGTTAEDGCTLQQRAKDFS